MFLAILTFSCSQNKQIISFSTPDPKKEALKENQIQTVYYVVDSVSIDTAMYGSYTKVGDTLSINKFDSTGNLISSRTNKAFSISTNYRYDKNGFIKHKRMLSDFYSEWFVCTFIDTTKRIGYQKWFDQLSDAPTTIFYYNQNGLTDSIFSATYSQSGTMKFKEYFFYNNTILTKTIKKTINADTAEAMRSMKMLKDTTEYFYTRNKLTKIKQTVILPQGQFNVLTEYFNKKQQPYKKEIITQQSFIREQIIVHLSPSK